jgi:hypothetical protein
MGGTITTAAMTDVNQSRLRPEFSALSQRAYRMSNQ